MYVYVYTPVRQKLLHDKYQLINNYTNNEMHAAMLQYTHHKAFATKILWTFESIENRITGSFDQCSLLCHLIIMSWINFSLEIY